MYNEQVRRGQVSEKAKFEYAWCLVRSKYIDDMRKGVALLEGKPIINVEKGRDGYPHTVKEGVC